MNYRQLIAEAWEYTQQNKKLIWWLGFLPAIFTTTVGACYIAYQFFALQRSYLFDYEGESLLHEVVTFIWTFAKENFSLTIPIAITAGVFYVINLLLPTLTRAAAIQKIARDRNGQHATLGTGIRYGFMSFLPLFEYHMVIKTFALFSILIEMSFVLRNLGPGIFSMLLPVFVILIIISIFLTLFFTYTDFFIVIDDEKVFKAMVKSSKLVLLHWKHTFLITILMAIIGIRIVIQAVMVFLIPALIILISGYIATVTLPITGVVVGGIVGFIALLIAAYLNGVVDIFAYTVWTFSFLSVTTEKELSAREAIPMPKNEPPIPTTEAPPQIIR